MGDFNFYQEESLLGPFLQHWYLVIYQRMGQINYLQIIYI